MAYISKKINLILSLKIVRLIRTIVKCEYYCSYDRIYEYYIMGKSLNKFLPLHTGSETAKLINNSKTQKILILEKIL